ncbi:aminoacyl-tRNA hydrolase [Candidatus Saccharibacteria bacterium]|nr:aminoacyl-tRNA hydrolase [Candidatus Saccharibacteria bacterium]
MKLVVGLGNPGNRYNFTRHNVGFLALDFYFKVKGLEWNENARLGAIWGRDGETLFIKPQEYYNETGRVVAEYMRYYKIPLSDVLVICDNFDLEFGMVRYRSAGSAGGNNGLKSIDGALGSSDYARIRVGTGNDELRKKMGDIDFVLSKFTPEEKERLPELLADIVSKIDAFIDME